MGITNALISKLSPISILSKKISSIHLPILLLIFLDIVTYLNLPTPIASFLDT